MVSTRPFISKSSNPLFQSFDDCSESNQLQLVSPSLSCSTVFISIAWSMYLSLLLAFFWLYSVVCGDNKVHNSTSSPLFFFFFFFCWLSQGLIVWPRLGDSFVSQNPKAVCVYHSPREILGCAYTICSHGGNYFVASNLFLLWNYWSLMDLFCAPIRRDSISLKSFSFLSYVQVFSSKMSLVCRLKCPHRFFSSHFCFLVTFVLVIISGGCYQSSSALFNIVFESLYQCIHTILNAAKSSSAFSWHIYARLYASPLVFLFSSPFV